MQPDNLPMADKGGVLHMRHCSPLRMWGLQLQLALTAVAAHSDHSALQVSLIWGMHLAVYSYCDMTCLALNRFCLAHHSACGVSWVGSSGWMPERWMTMKGHLRQHLTSRHVAVTRVASPSGWGSVGVPLNQAALQELCTSAAHLQGIVPEALRHCLHTYQSSLGQPAAAAQSCAWTS